MCLIQIGASEIVGPYLGVSLQLAVYQWDPMFGYTRIQAAISSCPKINCKERAHIQLPKVHQDKNGYGPQQEQLIPSWHLLTLGVWIIGMVSGWSIMHLCLEHQRTVILIIQALGVTLFLLEGNTKWSLALLREAYTISESSQRQQQRPAPQRNKELIKGLLENTQGPLFGAGSSSQDRPGVSKTVA